MDLVKKTQQDKETTMYRRRLFKRNDFKVKSYINPEPGAIKIESKKEDTETQII